MAPLDTAQKEALSRNILNQLSFTRYACSSLTTISGGTTNFVFHGTLAQPIEIKSSDATAAVATSITSVIIKYSADFVPGNQDFALDASRCGFEEVMLKVLEDFKPIVVEKFQFKSPHLFYFDGRSNFQVIEHIPGAIDLRPVLSDSQLSPSSARAIGQALGQWLRHFHTWSSESAQAGLRENIMRNKAMRELKWKITYGAFINLLEKFPAVIDGYGRILEDVKNLATREFARTDTVGEDWGIIHGDFWTGNVLLPETSRLCESSQGTDMYIIDWEFTQIGSRAIDLGQMIGDLYEKKHFRADAISNFSVAIQGFISGYGTISEDLAFRTAIHAGVYLIYWYIRNGGRASEEKILGLMKFARDLIVMGFKRDEAWFEGSVLAPLFGDGR